MAAPIITEDILSHIPQRPPFVMIDRLIYSDMTVTRSGFLVRGSNIFVENGKFREPGLLENIAQTAAAHAGYTARKNNLAIAGGYIGAVRNLTILDLPGVNDELTTEIVVENQVFNVTLISGKVWSDKKLVAQCDMKIFGSTDKAK